MTWQLVAHPDPELREVLGLHVRNALEALGLRAAIADAGNAERARQVVQEFGADHCSLVVLASTLPPDARTSAGLAGREPTKQLVKELKRRWSRLPLVVVSSTPDDRLADFLDAFDRVALVGLDTQFGSVLETRVGELHAREGRRSKACLKLDIHLSGDERASWQMRRLGADPFEASGTLHLDEAQLRRVIRDSQRLDTEVAEGSTDWLQAMSELSTELRTLLFHGGPQNFGFLEKFLIHRERVGGIPHTRVRVTVSDRTHPMLVEALRDEEVQAPGDYWMLQAPVFRRYEQQVACLPLFKDKATRNDPINALVIEADGAAGNVPQADGSALRFERLPRLQQEAAGVAEVLARSAGGRVEHLRLADVDGDPAAVLLARLAERPWHIVHFCGHLAATAAGAHLVLRADRGGLLPVNALHSRLERTQLLFLASCRSAGAKVVLGAVEQRVPVVMGFQWVVDDERASAFALAFYRLLFDPQESCHRYLEYAFMKARRATYEQQPQDPSWVAPVLVMQMD